MPTDCIILDEAAPSEVQTHPMVVFSMLDHFLRRPAGASRVIGVLLGKTSAGTMEVTNIVPVHHEVEDKQMNLSQDSMSTMLSLMKRVDRTQTLVGWYVVGGARAGDEVAEEGLAEPLVGPSTMPLHEYFASLDGMVDCPLHLTLDASLASDALPVAAFFSLNEALAESGLAIFEQAPVRITPSDAERAAMDTLLSAGRAGSSRAMAAASEAAMSRHGAADAAGSVAAGAAAGKVSAVPRDVDGTSRAIARLAALLSTARAYVDDVAKGKRAADPEVGTAIGDALAAVPRLPADVAEAAVRGEVSDLAVAGYLASLTTAQLALSERIASSVPLPLP